MRLDNFSNNRPDALPIGGATVATCENSAISNVADINLGLFANLWKTASPYAKFSGPLLSPIAMYDFVFQVRDAIRSAMTSDEEGLRDSICQGLHDIGTLGRSVVAVNTGLIELDLMVGKTLSWIPIVSFVSGILS